jgi:acetylornithine deacetylase
MDARLFLDILNFDSTSGSEGELSDFLAERFLTAGCRLVRFDNEGNIWHGTDEGRGACNLLFIWGDPKVVFCTHLDTVPPYIPPVVSDGGFAGRGTCDAKGQIMAMYEACLELELRGCTDFALLLLSGEETGSFGAKAFNRVASNILSSLDDAWLVVGEPTDNMMASAAKGTKAFEVEFTGKAFHSGYPQYGKSAVMMFNDFVNALRSIGFPYDEVLGDTTWNIGRLHSDNPQNILSDSLSCRVYFRTTFESDEMVSNVMKNMAGPGARLRFGRPRVQDGSDIVAKEVADWQKSMKVTALGGDMPTRFEVLDGFPSKPVSFGSDAPQLTCFRHRILCGPGSILVAHRDDEHIAIADMEAAVKNYIRIYEQING